jgi:hypothetical protein
MKTDILGETLLGAELLKKMNAVVPKEPAANIKGLEWLYIATSANGRGYLDKHLVTQ